MFPPWGQKKGKKGKHGGNIFPKNTQNRPFSVSPTIFLYPLKPLKKQGVSAFSLKPLFFIP